MISPLVALTLLAAIGTRTPATAQTVSRDTSATAVQAPAAAAAPADLTASPATTYQLVQVGGKPLPVEVEKEWRCREDVTAGKLSLGTDGRWLLETTEREVCGDRTRTELESDDGRYTTEGQTLRFFDEDGEENTKDWSIGKDIDLADLRSGTIGADGTLTVQLADEETTLVFRR
jgi:hypothetical protein